MSDEKTHTNFLMIAGSTGETLDELERLINEDGWELYGEPHVYNVGLMPHFTQMLKRSVTIRATDWDTVKDREILAAIDAGITEFRNM